MSERPYKRSIFNVLFMGVPGARESILLIFAVLSVFFFSVFVSSYFFIKGIQIGNYAELIISSNVYLLLSIWFFIWLISFTYSVRGVMYIMYRIAGPIKRIERLLDEVIMGKDVKIVLRDKDALSGVAKRINKLIEMVRPDRDE